MREDIRENKVKRNIVLVGPMGTGKSHVGRTLARSLKWQFVDTDRYIERQFGETIAEIGARLGNEGLAQCEHEVIERVRRYHEAVIAVGGNFVAGRETLRKLSRYGVIVLLYARTFRIVERVERKVGKRPTMDYDNVRSCVADLNREWYERRDLADISINTTYRSPTRIVNEIKQLLQPIHFIGRQDRYQRKGRLHGQKTGGSDKRR